MFPMPFNNISENFLVLDRFPYIKFTGNNNNNDQSQYTRTQN